nr:MAG TPA: PolyVal ADP-Ribosyltransferase [Caudoviricetes sp.]
MPYIPYSVDEIEKLKKQSTSRYIPYSSQEIEALKAPSASAPVSTKGITGTTTKVSAASTGRTPVAEPYQVPLPDAMVSVSGGRAERSGGSADSLAPAPFESVVNNPDFATLSKYKSDKSDAGKRFDFQNKAYHYLNDSSYWDGNQTLADIDAAIFTRNDALSEMTPLEISIYNYYVNSGDRKTAQAYLQSLRTKLQERKADTIAKEISKKDGADKVLSAAGLALTGGMSAANSGLEQYLEMLTGSDKIVDKNWMEQAQANVRPELSGGLGVMSDVLYSAGNMANSAVLGAANPVAGATLMGAQTAGNAYGDTIKEGYSKNEALLYAGINGALESGLQYVLGGIGALGKGGASKLLAKVPALQTLGKTIEASIKNPTVQAGLKSAGKYIASMGDEAFEEYLQSVVDPVVRNAVLDENNELNPLSEDALYSALVGAISGGLMNLPGAVTDFTGSKRADTSANGQWTNGANDDIMETVKGGSLDGRENAQQENAPGGHAGVPGQIFTVTDSELEKTVPGMERRADYRGVGLAVTEALQKRGITPVALAYTNDSDGFHQAIGRAKQNNMHGAFVTQHEVSEYANDALFLSEDGNTGVAVTPDGDIVSVFKNPNGKAKKAVHSILLTALENGGVKLDNFDGALSDMYWNHGFIPVVRTSFDPEFAPTDWNYARDGQPDIIFWVHNGEDAQTVARRIGEYGDLPDLTKLPVMSYDEAAAYRDNILKQRADSGNTGSAFFDADSKGSTDNIDAIVRDVFGYGKAETQGEVRKPDLSQEAKSSRAAKARETGSMFNINPNDIETAAILAEQTGRNIEFVETLGEGRNGKYDAETGTLYIAADSPNPVKTILKHELTHSLEGTQAYTELSKFVSDILVKETGMSLDEIIEAKIGIYGLSGETLDSNGALAELVADYVGDNLFTSEKAIRQLSAEKPSLARRILNWIRSMKTKLFGTNHEKLMAEAERMYHDALMEPFVKGSDSSYAKYSIQHDADGKRYVHVDTDQEIFNGKSVKEMRETARKYILDAFRGKVLPVGDGDKAFVNGRSASEYANPANRRMPDELKSAKMRASTELDNLLAVSDKIGNVPDDGRHPEATGGWDVYRTNFEVGGEMFSGEVKIKVTDKGRLFYDVTKIERTARNRDQTRFNPAAASGSSSDTTIPQTHNGVNTSISENSAYDTGRYALKTRVENSDGVELTDGQERYFEKSQARDDEGRLLVVYHATDADFTVFDKAKQGSANDPGVWGSGFYFDTDQSFAEEFGSKSKPYYLNITNPLRTTYDADCHVVAGIFRRAGIDIPFKIKPDTSLLQFIKKFGNRKFSDTLQALGYDGVIVSGEECVIFEPEQAKLTNNINPSGDPDIRHSIGVSSGDTIADIKAMVERYGAIKRGEAPARDVEIPKQTNDQTRTRQYVRTAAEASQVPDSFINGITQDVMNDVYAYVPISNNEAMERAVSTVENMGLDKAIEQWNAAVNGEHMPSKYDVALGEYLLTLAGKNNDPALASKMIIELSTVATNAGQAVQAMSMLKRMTPEGQLMALQKVADRINRERPDSNVKIPETIIDRVQRVNPRDTEAVDQIMHDGLVAIAEQVPSTWLDKWNAWRYLAMLGNPRTHIRNIAGNAAFAPIVYTKDFLAGAIEGVVDAASKATGGQGIARTKTALSALPFSKRSEYLDFVREDFQKMKDVINGGGGKNPADVVRDNQKVFTSKLMQPVEKAGKRSSKLLEAEDLAFKKIHYERALMQYLAANKIDLSTVTEETLNRGRNYAIREAQKATFADASAFASALNRLSRQHKAAQFLIEGNLPFKKTPVNILKRGVEYSPAGILDTVTRKAYQLKSGKISTAEFIDSLSAGLTGTGVMALGMWLASAGLLSGGLGDDKDDQFSKLQGEQEYALQIGDTSYTIDWAAPAALPLFVGAEIVDLYRDSKTGEVPLSKLLESLTNLSEPMVNMSMLQGVKEAIENVKFSNQEIPDIIFNSIASYMGQGVPTLLGQIARTTDDTRRRNYVEQGSAFPSLQMALQRNKSKIPGALQTQQPYVDAWGREETTGNIAERAFSNFLSPGYTSEKQTSSMEKELERLYEETGDAGVLPSSAQKSITNQGEKYVLTAEEYTEYQRAMGKTSYELLSKLTGSSEYKKLTDEQRTDAVSEVYSYAKDLAKEEMLKSRGVKYEASSKRQSMDVAKKNGVPLSMYLLYSIQAKDLKSDKKSNGDTVSGSLKRKKEEILNNMGVTAQQKRVLLLLDGYGSKQQREQLLTGTVSSGSSYEETAIDRLLKGALS